MKKVKGFTLIEIIVVIVIIGILSIVLLRTYTWISQITFRVQQTKNVHQEVLHISQIVQSFADNNTIDFEKYPDLTSFQGLTNNLYLKGKDGEISFSLTGECGASSLSGSLVLSGDCILIMEQSGTIIQLTDSHKVVLRNLVFKIIPFASQESYVSGSVACESDYLHCIHKPGFRMLMDAYSINYGKQRFNNVRIPVQLFF